MKKRRTTTNHTTSRYLRPFERNVAEKDDHKSHHIRNSPSFQENCRGEGRLQITPYQGISVLSGKLQRRRTTTNHTTSRYLRPFGRNVAEKDDHKSHHIRKSPSFREKCSRKGRPHFTTRQNISAFSGQMQKKEAAAKAEKGSSCKSGKTAAAAKLKKTAATIAAACKCRMVSKF